MSGVKQWVDRECWSEATDERQRLIATINGCSSGAVHSKRGNVDAVYQRAAQEETDCLIVCVISSPAQQRVSE